MADNLTTERSRVHHAMAQQHRALRSAFGSTKKVLSSVMAHRRVPPGGETVDLLLVCSTGGHLVQMVALRPAWSPRTRVFVTFDKSDARTLLAGERVIAAYGPTNRNVVNLVRNTALAARTLCRLRPRAVVTTGAGVAIPFAWLGRLAGADVVYVESLARVDGPSLTLRLLRPVASRIYVQWPEMTRYVRGSRFAGAVFAQ